MYQTRFVYELPLDRAGEVAAHVTNAMQECGAAPTNVRVQPDHDRVYATITYHTSTVAESDSLIRGWKTINVPVQMERVHKICPDQFERVALAGRNGRALRAALSREVRDMCARGIGSKGILEYLDECQSIVEELQEFVESQRASS
jgi:hypothetical protein